MNSESGNKKLLGMGDGGLQVSVGTINGEKIFLIALPSSGRQ